MSIRVVIAEDSYLLREGVVRLLEAPVRLLLAGDGPLRDHIGRERIEGGTIELLTGITHDEMPRAYAEMDVLVLISNCPQLNNPCNAYDPTPVEVLVWANA